MPRGADKAYKPAAKKYMESLYSSPNRNCGKVEQLFLWG